MIKADVLVIDDEEEMQRLLEITLKSSDFKVSKAMRGREGLIMASNHPPDLIILDLGLPDLSGHQVLLKLREWYEGPIIIVSVINSETDIVQALDNGADDYVVKPFRTGELIARIRTAMRRWSQDKKNEVIDVNGLQIDFEKRLVKKEGITIKLTATEYNLLALLVKNDGRVLTHRLLLQQIWGPGFQEQTQYLRVYIAQLRKKIEDDPNHPGFIHTESGIGYRFTGEEMK
jgi:two-component system KDP operon response regulator KdpE